mmetsp:Transcript_42928/g.107424  ORF Transcript_42928/g.107424 Transcript_42928/m.107424 type:complete len:223 (+) Transcript_42928:148-816(+)
MPRGGLRPVLRRPLLPHACRRRPGHGRGQLRVLRDVRDAPVPQGAADGGGGGEPPGPAFQRLRVLHGHRAPLPGPARLQDGHLLPHQGARRRAPLRGRGAGGRRQPDARARAREDGQPADRDRVPRDAPRHCDDGGGGAARREREAPDWGVQGPRRGAAEAGGLRVSDWLLRAIAKGGADTRRLCGGGACVSAARQRLPASEGLSQGGRVLQKVSRHLPGDG